MGRLASINVIICPGCGKRLRKGYMELGDGRRVARCRYCEWEMADVEKLPTIAEIVEGESGFISGCRDVDLTAFLVELDKCLGGRGSGDR